VGFDKEAYISDVARIIRIALERDARRLAGVRLSPRVGPVRVTDGDYEFYVDFCDERGVADVIEFHAIRKHKPVADIAEVERWLESTLADVLRRAEERIRASSAEH
jgi:hypothetical protein